MELISIPFTYTKVAAKFSFNFIKVGKDRSLVDSINLEKKLLKSLGLSFSSSYGLKASAMTLTQILLFFLSISDSNKLGQSPLKLLKARLYSSKFILLNGTPWLSEI
eukprot:NODE_521_length_7287_cov_0.275042.p5 type:complete len:107 gc:universal NODE_521_length_7287_cov_0.275042:4428-4108(-)